MQSGANCSRRTHRPTIGDFWSDAYKLQEIAFRKENRNLLQNNQKRIQTLIRNGKPLKRSQDYCPIPGTVLIREYKGVEHRVTVTHDGQFEYQGCVYRSLSRIAREITGAQWSGPLFFGLRKPCLFQRS